MRCGRIEPRGTKRGAKGDKAMRIRETTVQDASAVAALVDSVARERRFLAATSGFSGESTAAFIDFVRTAKGVHMVAEENGRLLGWCDVTPVTWEGMTHVGRLGMGVKEGFRGRGIGKALLREALAKAFAHGLERVELEVFRSNEAALRLYQSHGFDREGVKVAARRLDGRVEDILMFALLAGRGTGTRSGEGGAGGGVGG